MKMGYDLTSTDGTDFSTNIYGWRAFLELAHFFGWKPRGTEPPCTDCTPDPEADHTSQAGRPAADWDGGYFSNDGQRVTPEDAAQIANALSRALPCIPADPIPLAGVVLGEEVDCLPPVCHADDATPMEKLAGCRSRIIELIKFCKRGGFSIG